MRKPLKPNYKPIRYLELSIYFLIIVIMGYIASLPTYDISIHAIAEGKKKNAEEILNELKHIELA